MFSLMLSAMLSPYFRVVLADFEPIFFRQISRRFVFQVFIFLRRFLPSPRFSVFAGHYAIFFATRRWLSSFQLPLISFRISFSRRFIPRAFASHFFGYADTPFRLHMLPYYAPLPPFCRHDADPQRKNSADVSEHELPCQAT